MYEKMYTWHPISTYITYVILFRRDRSLQNNNSD